MPNNELIPFYERADRLTGQASAAVTGKRLLAISGNRVSGPAIPGSPSVGASDPTDGGNYQVAHAAAQGAAIGASTWDAAIGEKVDIIRRGVVPITAAANIVANARLEAGANGQVQTLTTGVCIGIAMTGCLSGADCEVLLQV